MPVLLDGPVEASQRQQGPVIAVKVVVDHESGRHIQALVIGLAAFWGALGRLAYPVSGKPRTGEIGLVPTSVRLLDVQQILDPSAAGFRIGFARRDERQERPRRLRCGGGADSAQRPVHI